MTSVLQTVGVLASVVIAYLAWRTTGRSAVATEQSAQAAQQATTAATASARAAEMLTEIEVERRHDELRPRVDATFHQKPSRVPDRSDLYLLLTNNVDRDYRYNASINYPGGGQQSVGFGTLLAGKTEQIHVTDLEMSLPDVVEVAFEPDGWDCSCGRGSEHWTLRRQLPPYQDYKQV